MELKKGKNIMIATIGMICFILTYVIFIQFKTIEETNITEIETMTETELREKIALWKEKYEETNQKLQETNETIAEYRNKKEANQEAVELLDKELLQAQILAGETDVKGDGIVITLTQNDESEELLKSYVLLRLINELNSAGAEAISINDQRITNMSDIVDIYIDEVIHYILINKDTEKRIVSPYVIKAIGDPKYLESALTTKTVGFTDIYADYVVSLERQNNIRIPKYSGNIEIKYIDMEGEK